MKRYEVRGMMEWHPVFKVGRGRLQVSFTGGHLSAGGCTPASFETSDPVVQKVIENSLPFRRGQIKVMGGGHPDRRPAGPVAGMPPGSEFSAALAPEGAQTECACGAAVRMTAPHDLAMEFDTLGEAQDFLQAFKSVPIDDMLTYKECVAMGARLGIRMTIKNTGTV